MSRQEAEPEVAVVGAGVAGLAAATLLADAGARVVVLEASKLAGGRARSWTDPRTGAVVDNGQHLLMACYRETLELLDRIGARSKVEFQDSLRVDFVDIAGEGGTIDCPELPGALPLIAGLLAYRGLEAGDRWRLARMMQEVRRDHGAPESGGCPAARDETVAAYLARMDQSAAARRNFWDPLVLATLNERPEIASARALRIVLRLGLLAGPEASRLGWSRVGLSDLFAAPAAEFLAARRGAVRLAAPVQRIVPDRKGVALVLRTGETLRARACIAAVPPSALERILPEELARGSGLEGLGGLQTSPIVGVSLWFDRSIVEPVLVGLLGTRMQWLFNKGRMLDADRGRDEGYVALVASGARAEVDLSPEAIVRLALRELRLLFPAARRAKLRQWLVVKEKEATVSPAAGWDRLRPGCRTGSERLFLAGDWTATGLPPTIESAAVSGHRAARAVLEGARLMRDAGPPVDPGAPVSPVRE